MRRLLLASLVALTACGGGGNVPDDLPPATVVIQDFSFRPGELVVGVGDTVTWSNQESGVAHTTTARDDRWHSGVLQPGQFFRHTFTEPGRYEYFCAIHPRMQAVVLVEG